MSLIHSLDEVNKDYVNIAYSSLCEDRFTSEKSQPADRLQLDGEQSGGAKSSRTLTLSEFSVIKAPRPWFFMELVTTEPLTLLMRVAAAIVQQ